jgi:hypothetical protein
VHVPETPTSSQARNDAEGDVRTPIGQWHGGRWPATESVGSGNVNAAPDKINQLREDLGGVGVVRIDRDNNRSTGSSEGVEEGRRRATAWFFEHPGSMGEGNGGGIVRRAIHDHDLGSRESRHRVVDHLADRFLFVTGDHRHRNIFVPHGPDRVR